MKLQGCAHRLGEEVSCRLCTELCWGTLLRDVLSPAVLRGEWAGGAPEPPTRSFAGCGTSPVGFQQQPQADHVEGTGEDFCAVWAALHNSFHGQWAGAVFTLRLVIMFWQWEGAAGAPCGPWQRPAAFCGGEKFQPE